MTKIVIATCLKTPGLTPGDAVLAKALTARGAEVLAAPWNGPFAPFAAADAVLIRSTWDYFDVAGAFADWIEALRSLPAVVNRPDVLRWNMTKDYLFELAEKGAPVPPLARADPDPDAIAAALDALGLGAGIVKPICGGSASGLARVSRDDRDSLARAAAGLNGPAFVQPFLPEIETAGETSFIFFGGAFSHAVVKRPKPGDIRVQEEHGGLTSAVAPPAAAIAAAARILSLCPPETAYARVDMVISEDRMALMEVELVEPELFFPYCPEGAERFINAFEQLIART